MTIIGSPRISGPSIRGIGTTNRHRYLSDRDLRIYFPKADHVIMPFDYFDFPLTVFVVLFVQLGVGIQGFLYAE